MIMRFLTYSLTAIALVVASAVPADVARAAEWPPSKITIVSPHDAGSGNDRIMRALADVWQEYLGTKFIHVNKAGASGRIGYDYFMNRPGGLKGNVLLGSNVNSGSMMYAVTKPKWDWKTSLWPLGLMAIDPGTIYVQVDSPYKTIQDFIDASKKQRLRFGLGRWSNTSTVTMVQVIEKTGADLELIPFNKSKKTIAAIMGGHAEAGLTKLANVSKSKDSFRILALTYPTNPAPELTNNAPPLDKALNIKTVPVLSDRVVMVRKEFMTKYPDRYRKLRETFEKAKDDPRFVENAVKQGFVKKLIVDDTPEQINERIKANWDAYERYSYVFEPKKKKKGK